MKIASLLLLAALALTARPTSATVWKVDQDATRDPDFTTLAAAQAAPEVLAGDTLQIYGADASYGGFTMTKRLVLVGTGAFLTENPGTQADTRPSTVGTLVVHSGATGSTITGLTLTSYVSVSCDSILFTRNVLVTSYTATQITVNGDYNIFNGNFVQRTGTHTSSLVAVNGQNTTLSNNHFFAFSGTQTCVFSAYTSANTLLLNNTLRGNINVNHTILVNNILREGDYLDNDNSNATYNLASGTQFGSEYGNQENVDMETVFVGTGSTDGQWQLAPASPAEGAGLDGVDCGAFGGADPYVLSCMPAGFPSITFFVTSGAGFVLPVEVHAQAH